MSVLETVCIKLDDGSGILLIAIRGFLSTGSMDSLALNLLCNKSRMMREYHVRFRERFGVKLPLPTRQACHTFCFPACRQAGAPAPKTNL